MKFLEPRPSQFLSEPLCCTGDCRQGRDCPIRQACEQAEPEETTEEAHPWLWWVYIAALVGTVGVSALIR